MIDIISHTGHIWSQLLLGKKTDGKVLVRGHEGWVQSGGERIILFGGKQGAAGMANTLACRIRHGSLLTKVQGEVGEVL